MATLTKTISLAERFPSKRKSSSEDEGISLIHPKFRRISDNFTTSSDDNSSNEDFRDSVQISDFEGDATNEEVFCNVEKPFCKPFYEPKKAMQKPKEDPQTITFQSNDCLKPVTVSYEDLIRELGREKSLENQLQDLERVNRSSSKHARESEPKIEIDLDDLNLSEKQQKMLLNFDVSEPVKSQILQNSLYERQSQFTPPINPYGATFDYDQFGDDLMNLEPMVKMPSNSRNNYRKWDQNICQGKELQLANSGQKMKFSQGLKHPQNSSEMELRMLETPVPGNDVVNEIWICDPVMSTAMKNKPDIYGWTADPAIATDGYCTVYGNVLGKLYGKEENGTEGVTDWKKLERKSVARFNNTEFNFYRFGCDINDWRCQHFKCDGHNDVQK